MILDVLGIKNIFYKTGLSENLKLSHVTLADNYPWAMLFLELIYCVKHFHQSSFG